MLGEYVLGHGQLYSYMIDKKRKTETRILSPIWGLEASSIIRLNGRMTSRPNGARGRLYVLYKPRRRSLALSDLPRGDPWNPPSPGAGIGRHR